jgi:hypothetical protein
MDLNGISNNLLLIGFVLVSLCCLYLLFSNFSKTREIEEMKRKVEDLKNIFFNQQKHNDDSFAKMINLIQHQSTTISPVTYPDTPILETSHQQLKTVTITNDNENQLPTNIIINKEQSTITNTLEQQPVLAKQSDSNHIVTETQKDSETKEINIDLEELNDLDDLDEPTENDDTQDIADLDDIDNMVQLDIEEIDNHQNKDTNDLAEHIKNGIFATSAKIEIFDDNISISTEPIENLDDIMQNETNIDDIEDIEDIDDITNDNLDLDIEDMLPMTANNITLVHTDHHLLGHLEESTPVTNQQTDSSQSEDTTQTKTIIIDADNTLDNIIITNNQTEENTKTIIINNNKGNSSNIEDVLDDNLDDIDDLDKLLSGNTDEPKPDENTKKTNDLSSMSIKQLKELAKTHKLKTTGTKNELITALSKIISK